jgi:hypothetical protein
MGLHLMAPYSPRQSRLVILPPRVLTGLYVVRPLVQIAEHSVADGSVWKRQRIIVAYLRKLNREAVERANALTRRQP